MRRCWPVAAGPNDRLPGVFWRPKNAGLCADDVSRAIETLGGYCKNEEFYYTVIDREKPDEKKASMLLDTIGKL